MLPRSIHQVATSKYKAAQCQRNVFDPWNSSATGHQRSENSISSSREWSLIRNKRLNAQFGDATSSGAQSCAHHFHGGETKIEHTQSRMTTKSGHHSPHTTRRQSEFSGGDVAEAMSLIRSPCMGDTMTVDTRRKALCPQTPDSLERILEYKPVLIGAVQDITNQNFDRTRSDSERKSPRKLFASCVFYINGSTMPLISDHKMKQLIAQHGGVVHVSLARHEVTHVVVTHCSLSKAGKRPLASAKSQLEIQTKRHRGLRYVTVNWVLASIRTGRKLQEAGSVDRPIAPTGSRNVLQVLSSINTS